MQSRSVNEDQECQDSIGDFIQDLAETERAVVVNIFLPSLPSSHASCKLMPFVDFGTFANIQTQAHTFVFTTNDFSFWGINFSGNEESSFFNIAKIGVIEVGEDIGDIGFTLFRCSRNGMPPCIACLVAPTESKRGCS